MAERDRAAIDIDLVAVELEVADEILSDDRERLVDLEQIDIVEREAGLGSTCGRRYGAFTSGSGVPIFAWRDRPPGSGMNLA